MDTWIQNNDKVIVHVEGYSKVKNLICKVIKTNDNTSVVEVIEHKSFTICSNYYQHRSNNLSRVYVGSGLRFREVKNNNYTEHEIVSKPQLMNTVKAPKNTMTGFRFTINTNLLALVEAINYLKCEDIDYKWVNTGEVINDLYIRALDRAKAA